MQWKNDNKHQKSQKHQNKHQTNNSHIKILDQNLKQINKQTVQTVQNLKKNLKYDNKQIRQKLKSKRFLLKNKWKSWSEERD